MALLTSITAWARRIKHDVVAVYFAGRDARTPLLARCVALAVAAYALSPIDLIPDFIPVLGYLDDLLIIPLGLALVIRLLPPQVLRDARQKAATVLQRPRSVGAAVLIVSIWLACLGALIWWLNRGD